MDVVLYTTGCPQCIVLEKLLDDKGVEYKTVTDTKEMIKRGFATAPMLEVDGELKNSQGAFLWVNSL